LIRNILIAIISTAWICTFLGFFGFLLEFMKLQENHLAKQIPISLSYIDMSTVFFIITTILLGASVFFWTFIAANKLWPIKKNDLEKKRNQDQFMDTH